MKKIKIVAALALALAATPMTSFAGGNSNHWHGHGHGGGSWRWNGSAWVWGTPLLGAAVLGSILATPYWYRPPYTYAYGPYATPAYPMQRQCPNGYGGWTWC